MEKYKNFYFFVFKGVLGRLHITVNKIHSRFSAKGVFNYGR